jgi:hypothetical protein
MKKFIIWGLTDEHVIKVREEGLPEGFEMVCDSNGNYLYLQVDLTWLEALRIRLQMFKWNVLYGTKFVLLQK